MGERVTNGSFDSGLSGWGTVIVDGDGAAYVNTGPWDPGIYYCYISGWGEGAMSAITQTVDLTNVNTLTFDSWGSIDTDSGPGVGGGLYIDDVFYEAIVNAGEDMVPHSVDVSALTGNHVIKFALYQWEWGNAMGVRAISAIGSDIPPAPVANFSGTPTSGETPLSVEFTDLSTGTPTEWLWNFGDGFLSAVQNPTHVYETAGVYTVVLKATNAGGFDVKTRTNYIAVTRGPNRIHPLWTKQIGPL